MQKFKWLGLTALFISVTTFAADRDPTLVTAPARHPSAQGALHPDDAVTLERGLGHDLRDRAARDRDLPERRSERVTRLHRLNSTLRRARRLRRSASTGSVGDV